MMVFAGNANPQLAAAINEHLKIRPGYAVVTKFSDGEVNVEIDEHVRGKDVFIVQPTCAPTNDNLMELLIIADALRRSSAARITAVIPYYGYARQDRRPRSQRVPISAKLVADMIQTAGINRVLTVDLHADQIQGFFSLPVDNIYASPILLGDIWRQVYPRKVVVSPDVGGVVRARALAKRLGDADLAIIDKRRPKANEAQIMNIIGDVPGKTAIIVDDIVDTAGTLCQAARALKDEGADRVVSYVTHPVLSGKAIEKISASTIDELVVTDSIPLSTEAEACRKIRQVSIAELLAESIRRISNDESVSELFVE
ncbi:ribose-phosphate pyrophosphokinase [Aquisalimonas sp.]|uniref:ribose-phosphate pyrophosphokinase n=1 Tax=Aquisalimonas sp. TaxID=1872621 RepID=UPI0025B7CDFE|nr:ribose-phosphate pyrophosphokinase [Aquisalimonas sp.]